MKRFGPTWLMLQSFLCNPANIQKPENKTSILMKNDKTVVLYEIWKFSNNFVPLFFLFLLESAWFWWQTLLIRRNNAPAEVPAG